MTVLLCFLVSIFGENAPHWSFWRRAVHWITILATRRSDRSSQINRLRPKKGWKRQKRWCHEQISKIRSHVCFDRHLKCLATNPKNSTKYVSARIAFKTCCLGGRDSAAFRCTLRLPKPPKPLQTTRTDSTLGLLDLPRPGERSLDPDEPTSRESQRSKIQHSRHIPTFKAKWEWRWKQREGFFSVVQFLIFHVIWNVAITDRYYGRLV